MGKLAEITLTLVMASGITLPAQSQQAPPAPEPAIAPQAPMPPVSSAAPQAPQVSEKGEPVPAPPPPPGGMIGDVVGRIVGRVPARIAGDAAETIVGDATGGIVGGVAGGIIGGVVGGLPAGIAGDVTEGIVGDVTTGVVRGVAGGIIGGVIAEVAGDLEGIAAPQEPEPPLPPEPALAPAPPVPPEPPDLGDLVGQLRAGVKALVPVPPLPPELPDLPDMMALRSNMLELRASAKALRAPVLAGPMTAFEKPRARSDEEDRYYERGQRDLERSRWDEAVADFNEAATRGGSRADGALYWKAYAQNKLGRREDALATLGELHKTYPNSRWMDDAKALEIEVRQAAGKPVRPESASDDELKLMALNGLMNSDPERAIPMIEKLLHSSQSPKIKERALFVLTQTGSPHATQLVVQMAKGASNPDLQMKAVKYLGIMGAQKELGEVYTATNDVAVRREVLHAFMVSGAHDQLLAAAKKETNPDLRRVAINQLGVIGAHGDLWQLYQVEPTVEIKRQIINALFVGGDADHLLEIARTAKEPELKRDAIRGLGNMGEQRAGNALAAMYASESDPAVRKEIIRALFVQGNAHALVEIARKETNVDMKKEIVRHLSNMQSKEGTDYLMELLNK